MNKLQICNNCNKKYNPKIRFCPFCGQENPKKPYTIAKKAICPNCTELLIQNEFEKEILDICPNCQGLWLDYKEFSYLTSEKSVYQDKEIKRQFFKSGKNQNEEGYRKCIRCRRTMSKKVFKKISGVIIDICNDHGVWLDNGELEKIRCFIANGGLEKYQAYQDLKIYKNQEEIKKLASTVRDIAFVQRMTHLYDAKYWIFSILRLK